MGHPEAGARVHEAEGGLLTRSLSAPFLTFRNSLPAGTLGVFPAQGERTALHAQERSKEGWTPLLCTYNSHD